MFIDIAGGSVGGFSSILHGDSFDSGFQHGAKVGYYVGMIVGGISGLGTYGAYGGDNPFGVAGGFVQNRTTEFFVGGSLIPTLLKATFESK